MARKKPTKTGGRPPSKVGAERLSQNGYREIRTPQGWRYKHHVIAEQEILFRSLEPKNERVIFIDNDRTHITVDNLEIVPVKSTGKYTRGKTELERRVERLELLMNRLLLKLNLSENLELDANIPESN